MAFSSSPNLSQMWVTDVVTGLVTDVVTDVVTGVVRGGVRGGALVLPAALRGLVHAKPLAELIDLTRARTDRAQLWDPLGRHIVPI